MTAGGTDRERLLAYLSRSLGMLPEVPESMSRTLHASCMKTIRRLSTNGWIEQIEAVQLSTRVRQIMRNRQPSRCGFDDKE